MFKTLMAIVAGCGLLTQSLPAQSIDAAGITVDLGGTAVMHRTSVPYPQTLLTQNIQGTVTVQVMLDARGNVTDAQVVSGPMELRRTVLESVLQWHFARSGGANRQVSVTFQAPAASGAIVVAGRTMVVTAPAGSSQPASVGVMGGILGSVPANGVITMVQPPAANEPQRLTSIRVSGLNEQLKSELLAALPVHEGDMVSRDSLPAIQAAVRQYDEHLSALLGGNSNGEATLQISAPGAAAVSTASAANWPGVHVEGSVQQAKVVKRVMPVYPPVAKAARIQGHVVLNAQIGADGTMQQLAVATGHPLLQQAAMDAVRQWVYEPTLLNGKAVQVVTQIDVNFTLQE